MLCSGLISWAALTFFFLISSSYSILSSTFSFNISSYAVDSQIHTSSTDFSPKLLSQPSIINLPNVSSIALTPTYLKLYWTSLLVKLRCLNVPISFPLEYHHSPFPPAWNLIVLLAYFIFFHIQADTSFFPSSLPTLYCIKILRWHRTFSPSSQVSQ